MNEPMVRLDIAKCERCRDEWPVNWAYPEDQKTWGVKVLGERVFVPVRTVRDFVADCLHEGCGGRMSYVFAPIRSTPEERREEMIDDAYQAARE